MELYCAGRSGTHTLHECAVMVRNPAGAGGIKKTVQRTALRCMTPGTGGKVVAYKQVNLFTKVTSFYRSNSLQHIMTHALWVTHSPKADNGGFHSSQPTSHRVQKGAYGGVQKAGVHHCGLFSLMVKTFCSGSNQAHCRDSTISIHEMSKSQKRKREGKRKKKTVRGLSRREADPPPSSCFKESPAAIESEPISLGWGVRINEPVDHWRAVESYV